MQELLLIFTSSCAAVAISLGITFGVMHLILQRKADKFPSSDGFGPLMMTFMFGAMVSIFFVPTLAIFIFLWLGGSMGNAGFAALVTYILVLIGLWRGHKYFFRF